MTNATVVLAPLLLLLQGCSALSPSALQWEFTGGPSAQNIAAVLPDDKSPAVVYAALTNGELYVSTNNGTSWSLHGTVTRRQEIHGLVQDPETPDKIYAATDAGGFVSANRGKGWMPLHIAEHGTAVRALAIDPWSPSVVFAGTAGRGVYRSSDGGATWTSVSQGADPRLATATVHAIAVDPGKPDVVYAAAAPPGLVRSTDRGLTWTALTDEASTAGFLFTHILLKKNSPGVLLCGTSTGTIMKSVDGGQSWGPSRNATETDRIIGLLAHPANPDLVFAGTERGLFVSSDFGASWVPAGPELPRIATRVAVAGQTQSVYAFGSGIGLRRSTDNGAHWNPADLNLGGSTVSAITTAPRGDHLVVAVGTTCLTNGASTGRRWVSSGTGIIGGEVRSLAADPTEPGVLYATTPAGIFQTTNDGASWELITRTLSISPLLCEPHPFIKTRILAAGEQDLFISTDRGKNWGQPKPPGSRWQVRSFTFSTTNAGVIVAATNNSGVIISHDGGLNWESARYGLPDEGMANVALDDKDAEVFYAYSVHGDCFRSVNRGLEWNRYAPAWKPADSARIAVDRYQPNSVVALVNNRELYYSPGGGGTWFRVLDQDLKADVTTLHWNAGASMLYAGTVDKGVYKIWLGGALKELLGE